MRLPKHVLIPILLLPFLFGCMGAADPSVTLVPTATAQPTAVSPTPALSVPVSPASRPTASSVSANTLANCTVTRPPDPPFVPTIPRYRSATPDKGYFLFGTDSLWTELPLDGVWRALPLNPDGYTQKVFWWTKEYASPSALSVTARPLLVPAPPIHASTAGNIGDAMVIVPDFPAAGCWEITGMYLISRLSFVIWIDG